MAIKVSLRKKTISKGRQSLYLDFYPAILNSKSGKFTRRQFLGMYVFVDKKELKKEIDSLREQEEDTEKIELLHKQLKPLSIIEIQHNQNTLKIAESIRQKQENYLNKPEIYNEYEKKQLRLKELGDTDFIDFFQKLADKRKESNRSNWLSALKYLKAFFGEEFKFSDLNEQKINEFKEYLLTSKSSRGNNTTLSQNSAQSYFNKMKVTLKQAYQDGILQTDLNAKIKPIQSAETSREYLTLDELNRLVKTPCNDDLMKRAALFSSLTGLRFSDIQKMKWSELEHISGQGYTLKFSQKKTKGVEVLPISEQAYNLLGNPGREADRVFPDLKYSAYTNKHLAQWIGAAGITKNITFHCFRHTYATLQLFSGTDIYTVSKMLGHRNLKTTQVYAKIVDEAKREATNKIILNMPEKTDSHDE